MSVSATITSRIKHMPKGQPFAIERFAEVGTRASVDKALSRLVKAGELERVARGIYMRPKASQIAGKVRPSALTVVKVIAKANGETIQVHGAEAVRLFQLSTQMQTVPTFYTSGSTREIRVGNSRVRLKHASAERLQRAGTKAGLALSALFYLGKEGATPSMVSSIVGKLTSKEFEQLRSCKMPAWMSAALTVSAVA